MGIGRHYGFEFQINWEANHIMGLNSETWVTWFKEKKVGDFRLRSKKNYDLIEAIILLWIIFFPDFSIDVAYF